MNPRSGLPRRVLAIGAHPDDLELSCAGTLVRFVDAGAEVEMAVACRGDRGGDPEVRACEARRAAAILGVPIHLLGFGDGEIQANPEHRLPFLRLLREARPDLVITHAPNDYHADHAATSELVAQACWMAASARRETGQPPLEAPPTLVYMDNLAGIDSEPTHLVDVSSSMETKRAMLACHESQVRREDGSVSRLIDLAETLARLRGFQCGVAHAEGFRACLLWGRRRAEPLFP
jgi:LmbE family N-acetylglucosaminyl deacetylase